MAAKKPTPAKSTSNDELSYDAKTIITIVLLIGFYPVGLVLMYLWMRWPVWLKVLLTLPLVPFVLVFVSLSLIFPLAILF